jgi:hypothetical protein
MEGKLMSENGKVEETSTINRNRSLFIFLGIVFGLLVLAVIATIILFVLFDPLNIVGRLTGRYDPIANAIPPDTGFYVSFDLAQLGTKETSRIIRSFAEAADTYDIDDMTSALEELDQSLSDSYDLTVTDDILPWIGQHIGLSVSNFDFDYYDDPSIDLVFLIEVRSRKKADEFIAKLVREVKQESLSSIEELEYRGTNVYEIQSEYDFERFAFARFDSLFFLASSLEQLKDSVDAFKGDSFADTDIYKQISNELPKDRAITIIINPTIFENLQSAYEEILPGFDPYQSQQLGVFQWMASTVSTTDKGIQVDFYAAYDEESLASDQLSIFESEYDGEGLSRYFPERTLLYITGSRLDLIWKNMRESLGLTSGMEDFEESMELFENEFGFNPDQDLFPLFNGDWAIGVYHSTSGYLTDYLDVPLSFLIMLETSDDEDMQELLGQLLDGLEDIGLFIPWERGETDDLTIYELEDYYDGAKVFALGAGKGYFLLGMDIESLEEAFTRSSSLLDNEVFADAFAADSHPVMFLDLSELYDIVEDEFRKSGDTELISDLDFLRPLTTIVASSSPYENGIVHSTIVLFVESEE